MTIDFSNMTQKDIDAHVKKEQKLRGEMEAALAKLENGEYRTGTEKLYLNDKYRAKQRELDIHLGYIEPDE
jgi:hypothetical protein